jgi:ATP-dependent RNA/DNA helicase IGHMBP2
MNTINNIIAHLNICINLEEKEQTLRYAINENQNIKSLKANGLALHPIVVNHKNFGYADYPEIEFKLTFPAESTNFKDGSAIECFYANEEVVKGVLLGFNGTTGSFRLFAPDYPDWLEEKGVGIKLAPDTRTSLIMKKALQNIKGSKSLSNLFSLIYNTEERPIIEPKKEATKSQLIFVNNNLNDSQKLAITNVLNIEGLNIIHGPPGTGKTTTLVEVVLQKIKEGKKVIVAAPSNTATDNIAISLIKHKVNILRVGNGTKVNDLILPYTLEGKLTDKNLQKELKQLKIRAEQFRKMALKYKKRFGKAEQEQRRLLFNEVKNIRTDIKKLQTYNEEKLYQEAQVIVGTPVGIYDANLNKLTIDTVIIDEAGQCIQPLAWCILGLAPNIILAGDHLQLPPTVLSNKAAAMGFDKSILEEAINNCSNVFLLNTQYRMRQAIADFSSYYFYNHKLLTANYLNNTSTHIHFIDTAGSGFNETAGQDGGSLKNDGELELIEKIIENKNIDITETAFITPYAGQMEAAKNRFNNFKKINTIDSFQGQEAHTIIISLVRSNADGIIGFLKDYRRMNVALTRAKEQLFVIGDSATICVDPFYDELVEYIQNNGSYSTVWEYELI